MSKLVLPVIQPAAEAPRCTGRCCRAFVLTRSYAYIQTDFENWWTGDSPVRMLEIEKVFPMLVRLPGSNIRVGDGKPYEDGEVHERFTCNAFDQVTGNCRNYANRPTMCRQHGVSSPCDHWGYGCELPDYRDQPLTKATEAQLQEWEAKYPRDPATLKRPEVIGG